MMRVTTLINRHSHIATISRSSTSCRNGVWDHKESHLPVVLSSRWTAHGRHDLKFGVVHVVICLVVEEIFEKEVRTPCCSCGSGCEGMVQG
jgi:hypothetical protein